MSATSSLRKLSAAKGLTIVLCGLLVGAAIFAVLPACASPLLNVDVATNYAAPYYFMQTVGVYTNITTNGTPRFDGLIALEIDRPDTSWSPIVFRTIKGSQPTNPALLDGQLETLGVTPTNDMWQPKTSFKRGEACYLNVTIRNNGIGGRYGMVTASIIDFANTPLFAVSYGTPGLPNYLPPGVFQLQLLLRIPSWACLGTAKVYVNIFRDSPIYRGYPIAEEKFASFEVKSSYGTSMILEGYPEPERATANVKGVYNFSCRIPPNRIGTYEVYTGANYTNAMPNYDSTTFQVDPLSIAPQASFIYTPAKPYAGGTTYFDASASYSYNGTITNYRWTWGDGTPPSSTTDPFINHVFNNPGTFLVTLNVTDSQGLWGTTSKPVPVSGPTPPVAGFTFYPSPTWIGATTTFDASSSTLGWNGTTFVPIVNYSWNFGDGTPVVDEPDPVTTHQFSALDDFTVVLTVRDARSWTDAESHIVQVINVTVHPELVVTEVAILDQYELSADYWEPYKGWTGDIKVIVLNNGTTSASFNVTLAYSNGTRYSLGMRTVVNLSSQSSVSLYYQWNTSLLKPTMDYTITANATILLGETNTLNNRYNIIARVKGPGDANGNGIVNIVDATPLGIDWMKTVPPADPRADLYMDGIINIKDATPIGINWMKTYL